MTVVTRSGLSGFFSPQKTTQSVLVTGGSSSKKTQSVPVPGGPSSKKTQSGPVSGGHPRSTGTGDRDRTRSVCWTSPSVTMGVGDGEQHWNSQSGEDDGDCERRDDDVDLIETTSPAAGSPKSILHLPERSEDNTTWLFPEGIKPASVLNKMKVEDIATVCKRKEILATEVVKNGSVVDLW